MQGRPIQQPLRELIVSELMFRDQLKQFVKIIGRQDFKDSFSSQEGREFHAKHREIAELANNLLDDLFKNSPWNLEIKDGQKIDAVVDDLLNNADKLKDFYADMVHRQKVMLPVSVRAGFIQARFTDNELEKVYDESRAYYAKSDTKDRYEDAMRGVTEEYADKEKELPPNELSQWFQEAAAKAKAETAPAIDQFSTEGINTILLTQRQMRYRLLLAECLKETPENDSTYQHLASCMDATSNIVSHFNERVRDYNFILLDLPRDKFSSLITFLSKEADLARGPLHAPSNALQGSIINLLKSLQNLDESLMSSNRDAIERVLNFSIEAIKTSGREVLESQLKELDDMRNIIGKTISKYSSPLKGGNQEKQKAHYANKTLYQQLDVVLNNVQEYTRVKMGVWGAEVNNATRREGKGSAPAVLLGRRSSRRGSDSSSDEALQRPRSSSLGMFKPRDLDLPALLDMPLSKILNNPSARILLQSKCIELLPSFKGKRGDCFSKFRKSGKNTAKLLRLFLANTQARDKKWDSMVEKLGVNPDDVTLKNLFVCALAEGISKQHDVRQKKSHKSEGASGVVTAILSGAKDICAEIAKDEGLLMNCKVEMRNNDESSANAKAQLANLTKIGESGKAEPAKANSVRDIIALAADYADPDVVKDMRISAAQLTSK